jgi:hypothetical protein
MSLLSDSNYYTNIFNNQEWAKVIVIIKVHQLIGIN